MPAPAGYEEVAAPKSAKPPAGYDIVPPPPPSAQAYVDSLEPPGAIKRFAQGVGLPTSWDEVKATAGEFRDMATDPTGPGGHIAKGLIRNAAAHGKEAVAEVGDAAKNIREGGPVGANIGKAAYGVESALTRSIPGGEAVQNFGEDIADSNYRGATGDALATLAQAMMLRGAKGPKAATAVNKLGYVAGGEVPAIRAVLPEIQRTVGTRGVSTIGELADAVQATSTRLDQKFNTGLASMKGQFMPTEIADALESRARMQPPSADGQAIAAELRNMIPDYQRPWTDVDLNKERMMRNAFTKGFNDKSGSGQMAAMRSSAQTIADQTIADSARDLLYGRMEKAMPGQGFQALKQSQSHLIDIMDQLDAQVERLETQQAKFKGAPLLEKPGFTTSVSPHGVTPRVHLGSFLESAVGRGPMDKANSAAQDALPVIAGQTAKRRARVLALPLSKLTQRPAIPPPPTADDKTLTPSQ